MAQSILHLESTIHTDAQDDACHLLLTPADWVALAHRLLDAFGPQSVDVAIARREQLLAQGEAAAASGWQVMESFLQDGLNGHLPHAPPQSLH